jgi:hypothetical protein
VASDSEPLEVPALEVQEVTPDWTSVLVHGQAIAGVNDLATPVSVALVAVHFSDIGLFQPGLSRSPPPGAAPALWGQTGRVIAFDNAKRS